ncbi:MAG: hypothetical protein QM731_21060 [Chitinophagaceae bacterium]
MQKSPVLPEPYVQWHSPSCQLQKDAASFKPDACYYSFGFEKSVLIFLSKGAGAQNLSYICQLYYLPVSILRYFVMIRKKTAGNV